MPKRISLPCSSDPTDKLDVTEWVQYFTNMGDLPDVRRRSVRIYVESPTSRRASRCCCSTLLRKHGRICTPTMAGLNYCPASPPLVLN